MATPNPENVARSIDRTAWTPTCKIQINISFRKKFCFWELCQRSIIFSSHPIINWLKGSTTIWVSEHLTYFRYKKKKLHNAYQGIKYVSEENHQSKLKWCINPDKSSFHWTSSRIWVRKSWIQIINKNYYINQCKCWLVQLEKTLKVIQEVWVRIPIMPGLRDLFKFIW